jgi:hypothetical protein
MSDLDCSFEVSLTRDGLLNRCKMLAYMIENPTFVPW